MALIERLTRTLFSDQVIKYTVNMAIQTILVDLDDTLYPAECGLWAAIRARIDRYMEEQMHLPVEEIPSLRKKLFQEYGTTMRGLHAQFHIDQIDFLNYVHDVPLKDYLKPDPSLRELLKAFPQRKIILTNADHNHANRVIDVLGLTGIFDDIIDILRLSPFCKPQPEAFEKVLALTGGDHPNSYIFLDDSSRNLATASGMGFITVRVGSDFPDPSAHLTIRTIHELPVVLSNGKICI